MGSSPEFAPPSRDKRLPGTRTAGRVRGSVRFNLLASTLLRPGSLFGVTLPATVLLLSVATLRWDWTDLCTSYGFPLPHTSWYGSSLEWEVAPLFLLVDLAMLALPVLGLQRAWIRRIHSRRLTMAVATTIAVVGYGWLAVAWLLPAAAGLLHPRVHVIGQGLDRVAIHATRYEYCPNLDG